jgi:DNA-binding response OmpR family regulator
MGAARQVLVVDADAALLAHVRATLEDAGYAVQAIPESGEEVHQLSDRAVAPDVVLVDLDTVGAVGAEVVQAYRAQSLVHAPVIVLSGTDDAGDRAALVGAEDLLLKPVDAGELLEHVGRYAQHTSV